MSWNEIGLVSFLSLAACSSHLPFFPLLKFRWAFTILLKVVVGVLVTVKEVLRSLAVQIMFMAALANFNSIFEGKLFFSFLAS